MTVTVGVVGAGFMGETHVSSFGKIEGARVSHVCDIDASKGKPLARKAEAEYVPDFADLLSKELDIVDICLPTPLHRPFAVRALESGHNLFLEKPLAIDIEEGEAILAAAKKASAISMVGHVLRFWPGYTELHDRVNAGEIGDPRHFLAYRVGPPPAWAKWYMDMTKSNGVIFDLGIHDIDFVRWTMGEPKSVFSQIYETSGVHAHGQVLMDYCRGEALVECSWMGSSSFPFTAYAEIAGTEGLLQVNPRTNYAYTMFAPEGASTSDPYYEDGYVRELRHFVHCVRDDSDPAVPISEALRTIKVSVAAVQSAIKGGPVDLG